MVDNIIPIYVPHRGTIRISGSTVPKNAGNCAIAFLQEGYEQIDFFCIGANANQQATKSMGVFSFQVRRFRPNLRVSFEPLRFMTETTNPVTGVKKLKDCTVWRTILSEAPVKS
jgi:hypothetical protein